ncbi:FkbM family methyltransferase [bacterium]|nr:FkbM family methyltransferase [bacterium]
MFENFINNIFSINNVDSFKVWIIAGIKFKIKNKFKILQNNINFVSNQINNLKQNIEDKTCDIQNNLSAVQDSVFSINHRLLYNKFCSEFNYIKNFYNDCNNLDLYEKYFNLINNLDSNSVDTVNRIIARIKQICTSEQQYYDFFDDKEIDKIENNCKNFYRKIFNLKENCWSYNKYFLPINHFEPCVFIDKHFIDLTKTDYFKDKVIIDAGAFIGDSAIILSDYTNKEVHSFEPTSENYNNLIKTITLNKKENKIVPVKFGLGAETQEIDFNINSSASGILETNYSHKETCKIITLDDYVITNNLEVGLIKTDLEGFEQYFLKGAERTIKSQRPTLLISIYHTASDFFNIKPLIESWDLNYDFKIIKPADGQVLLETVLICEQKEINND